MFPGPDQSLEVLNPPVVLPEMDEIGPQSNLGEQDERTEVLNQDLQEHFDQSENKDNLPQDVHPYLGKLEQEGSLVCPESIEEPVEEVDGLILYQTVEEQAVENPLDADPLMSNASGEFEQMEGIPQKSSEGSPAGHTDLADQVDEISEGQVEHVSSIDVPVVQYCDENAKTTEMELENIYSEYAQPSCPAVPSPTVPSKSSETTRESDGRAGASTENSTDQDENLNLPDGSRDCRSTALIYSLDQDRKDNLLDQNEFKINPTLPVNSTDKMASDLLPAGDVEKKPEQLVVPVKVEETKMEIVDDACPDSSEVKHAHLFSYPVKAEDLITKTEQLHSPVKSETLESKPEDLSLPVKPENLDTKPEVLQFVAYSDGGEDKPEVKPLALGFTAYPAGAKLKTETKAESLRLTAFADTSAIKPEAKTECLGFTTYPDSSEIKPEAKPEFSSLSEVKAETKQEMLEADSTVLTPKVEQTDGLVDASESSMVKGQVKEERPSTPGKNKTKSSFTCQILLTSKSV